MLRVDLELSWTVHGEVRLLLIYMVWIDILGAAFVFMRRNDSELRVSMNEMRLTARCRFLWIGLLLACPAWPVLIAQSAPDSTRLPAPAPVHLTSEEDHQRLMNLLGIKELRPSVDTDAKSPHAANYDESKANVYHNLPDPLVLKNGRRVTSAKIWWNKRRPEIVEDFDREILGRAPAGLPKVTWEVVSARAETIGNVPVLTRRLTGHVDNSAYPQIAVNIDLILTTPAKASGPVPVILYLVFKREFTAATAGAGNVPKAIPGGSGGRPGDGGIPWQQQILARGWGFAILNPFSYQADNGAGLTEGIIGLMNKGQPRKLDDWGALRAWAWGASRVLDYLETDKAVDAKQVGIAGHSRLGKTALVALAYDHRFAVAYVSSSGEGGAKLYRHIFGEELQGLVSVDLYHWMAGNLIKYGGPLTPGDLPVDNHELIALCAPRPVFIGTGASVGDGYVDPSGDAQSDPMGMFLAEVAAGPVYRLLGKKDLGTTEFPHIGTALMEGDLGYRQHPGGHTPAPNWPVFLEFASRYLHAPAAH